MPPSCLSCCVCPASCCSPQASQQRVTSRRDVQCQNSARAFADNYMEEVADDFAYEEQNDNYMMYRSKSGEVGFSLRFDCHSVLCPVHMRPTRS